MTLTPPLPRLQIQERFGDGEKMMSIPVNRLYQMQQAGLMRLLLFVTGQVHTIVSDAAKGLRGIVLGEANQQDGSIDASVAYRIQIEAARVWGDAAQKILRLIEAGTRAGASMPFGVQAVYHEKIVRPQMIKHQSGKDASPIGEAITGDVIGGVFEYQLKAILQGYADQFGPDNLRFSTRIWKFDRESRDGINTTIMGALSEKQSAWQLAKNLEQYLGAGADCPKWTYARLNSISAADKAAGDPSGLLSGEDCGGKGVSYNALRLARTEIQRAHHLANDNRMAAMPWIEQEKIVLSGSHPEPDECDDVVNGGENGDGVYPVGTIELPIHPNCFCDKRAVQDLEKFGDQLSEWVRTGEGFPAMDQYQASLDGDLEHSLLDNPIAQALGVWVFDNFEELAARIIP